MKQFCRLVKTHTFLTCLVLAAVLLASIIIGIGTGPVAIPFAEVWRVMFHRLGGLLTGSELPLEGGRESTQNIVWFLRAPRVLLGALVGAALTLSGVGMQAFTKNPLAEPYVLGISSGASLGAVLAMLLGVSLPVLGRLSVSAGAFAGALVSILLVYLLARTRNAVTPMSTLRTTVRLTPRVTAELSPIIMALRGLARASISRRAGGTRPASSGTSAHSALPSPPSIQKVASRTAASSGAV